MLWFAFIWLCVQSAYLAFATIVHDEAGIRLLAATLGALDVVAAVGLWGAL
jgi:hypothetical protein